MKFVFNYISGIMRSVFESFSHVFGEYRVTRGRVGYENVSYCAHEFAVLDYRAAAHALNYTAGFLYKLLIGYADDHVFSGI